MTSVGIWETVIPLPPNVFADPLVGVSQSVAPLLTVIERLLDFEPNAEVVPALVALPMPVSVPASTVMLPEKLLPVVLSNTVWSPVLVRLPVPSITSLTVMLPSAWKVSAPAIGMLLLALPESVRVSAVDAGL